MDTVVPALEWMLRLKANEDAVHDAELNLILMPDRTEDEQ